MKPNILILLTLLFSILLSAHGWGYEARQRGEKQPRPSIMDQSVDDTAASLIDRHLSRAVILEKEGQIDLAIQELHGLLPFVKEKGTPHQRILALNQLGSLLAVLPFPVDQGSMATNKAVRSMRISPPDTGLNSLTEALALARAEHDGRLSSLVLNNLGTLHGTRRQYSRAASLYQESVQLARQSGGGTLLGASLANMGRLYASTGAAVEAKKSLEEAYRIWNDQPESSKERKR